MLAKKTTENRLEFIALCLLKAMPDTIISWLKWQSAVWAALTASKPARAQPCQRRCSHDTSWALASRIVGIDHESMTLWTPATLRKQGYPRAKASSPAAPAGPRLQPCHSAQLVLLSSPLAEAWQLPARLEVKLVAGPLAGHLGSQLFCCDS